MLTKMRMKHFFKEKGVAVAALFCRVRKNKKALFFLAFVIGGGIKLLVSPYITMGYNDYIAQRHSNVDFSAMRQEAQTKASAAQENTNQ